MRYSGFAYRQVSLGPVLFSFVGTSCEIDQWAKVPTKLASHPRHFQRAELPSHVKEIRNFFNDESQVNSSPTSLILGIAPEFQSRVRLCECGTSAVIDPGVITTTPSLCDLVIDFDPWESARYAGDDDVLNQEILDLYEKVRSDYESTEVGDDEDDEVFGEDNTDEGSDDLDNADESAESADDDDDEHALDDEEVDQSENDGRVNAERVREGAADEDSSESGDEALDATKDVKKFLASLTRAKIVELLQSGGFRTLPKHRREGLRDTFKDDLKPGLIIDGQHRVLGTAKRGEFPFSALLLPFASWGELAFQFIVNNGTAKKVGDGLLISIVGESLSPADLAETDARLNRAGVKVSLIQAVMHVQKTENPFAGMLNFGVPGEKGFLDSKAMKSKVVELWWGTRGKTGQRPNMKTVRVHEHREWDMYELFGNVCTGSSRIDRIRDWQDSKKWFEYFRSFWEAVSTNFKPRLWPPAANKWLPPNTRPTGPEQIEREKLMRVTVLGLLQTAVLQVWADNTNRKRTEQGKTMDGFKIAPAKFKQEISRLVSLVPYDFFTELQYTGFDASKDLRKDFVEQLVALLEMRKEFSAIKSTHRFWRSN